MQTPIYPWHVANGGKIVDFAGWDLPVEFKGLREEHNCVRKVAGLFDVSHMGEIRVTGPDALKFLQWVTTNDVSVLKANEAQYSLFPNDQGGLVDDLIVYCIRPSEEYFLCVNASNTKKDFDWLIAQKGNFLVEVVNESGQWGQVAIQGPKALKILRDFFGEGIGQAKPFTFLNLKWQSANVIVAFTGYTGEKGAEIFVPWDRTLDLWKALMELGEPLGLQPIGLGARDTLRTEMKYSLYGHELDDLTNPYEAGLGWVVKPDKKDFIGKSIIVGVKASGLKRTLVGIEMIERGIARAEYQICDAARKPAGVVTSGTFSPTLDKGIAVAFVSPALSAVGTDLFVNIRGKMVKARVVKTPFITPHHSGI